LEGDKNVESTGRQETIVIIDVSDFPTTKPVLDVRSAPAQLVYAGATAVALEIWNGAAWQAANDDTGTAITLTGAGNFTFAAPGYYRLNGTALTNAALYQNVV
jgi:hypothetical protein